MQPSDYFLDRSEYTKRTLSYEHDILNAFKGILHRSIFFTFWGAPVVRENSNLDPDTGFALGQL